MKAQRFQTRCYRIGDVVFVPHFSRRNTYVGPGGGAVATKELMARGAVPVTLMLWARGWALLDNVQLMEAQEA